MRINHNIGALNTHRQLAGNTAAQSKSIEKLSSGLRINRAGDDAAGLAISEKMRGQIRGLDQASRNAQDGISLIQTAEGALNETHSILQRMRELANQSANGTNTNTDRASIQDEINQLSSEINRIGNTTEFNTQKLLQGDGKVNLSSTGLVTAGTLASGTDRSTTEATQTVMFTAAAAAGNTAAWNLNGQTLTLTWAASGTGGNTDNTTYGVTANAASINIDGAPTTGEAAAGAADALQKMIDANDALKGNYKVTTTGSTVTVTAVKGGAFEGAAGVIGATTLTGITGTGNTANTGTTTNATKATKSLDLAALEQTNATTTDTNLKALIGKGMTINGQQVEFYNSQDGAYTGDALGVDISSALYEATYTNKADALATQIAKTIGSKIEGVTVTSSTSNIVITANTAGTEGNKIAYSDGGVQQQFKTTFQIGANTGQSMALNLNDMRSQALGVTAKAGTAGFSTANNVTDGTTEVKQEAALDVSTKENAAKAIAILDKAITNVSAERGKLGSVQNRLEHTINNLQTSSENLTAAESRVRDVDMAKEMMEQTKNSILAQAAQAMLAQANQQPQGVLQLLR